MDDDNKQSMKSRLTFVILLAAVLTAGVFIVMLSGPAEDPGDAYTEATPVTDTGVFEPLDAERELFLHCGNSMRPAAELLAAEFQDRHGIGVRLNFGGSSELLVSIELGEIGDLYLPHDPYAEKLEEKGLLDYYEVVGYLEPVIIVPRNNPKGIETMRELAERDLNISIPDRRYATAGKMVYEAFEKMGLVEELEANIEMEGRSHSDVAQGLIWGHVDAAMVWNFIGTFYKERLEMIKPPDADFPEVRMTLCMLRNAQDREAAEKFMDLATSDFGREVFKKQGYIVK